MKTRPLDWVASLLLFAGGAAAQAVPVGRPVPDVSPPPALAGSTLLPPNPDLSYAVDESAPGGDAVPGPAGGPGGTRWWASAEYLMWWAKKSPLPVPLISTGPLDAPGTRLLLGDRGIAYDLVSGGRFTAGYWLDWDQVWGVEGSFFFLAQQNRPQSVFGGATSAAGVPFQDVTTGAEGFFPLGAPGLTLSQSSLALSLSVEDADFSGIYHFWCTDGWRLGLLGGGSYFRLGENLTFSNDVVGRGLFVGLKSQVIDAFETRNDFFGGQLGLRAEYDQHRLSVRATAKLATGIVHQVVDVDGVTTLTAPLIAGGQTTVTPGGIFAQSSNIGNHDRDRLAVVPIGTFDVGYQLTEWARLCAGYSFVYASDVLRPGDQIDRGLNLTQSGGGALVGPRRPGVLLNEAAFWAHGLNVGLEFLF